MSHAGFGTIEPVNLGLDTLKMQNRSIRPSKLKTNALKTMVFQRRTRWEYFVFQDSYIRKHCFLHGKQHFERQLHVKPLSFDGGGGDLGPDAVALEHDHGCCHGGHLSR